MAQQPPSGKQNDQLYIKGLGASGGVVRGKCKLIYNIQQLGQIEKGDILVAPMTNPDFVLAMSKCAAIVTDSGGMICHAAIIAREFGITCVVGTGIATQILKDGMTVEVNGNEGFVRILKLSSHDLPQVSHVIKNEQDFQIFGNITKPIKLPIVRKQPIWPSIWSRTWPHVDCEDCFWIVPRPEIYGSFVQRSLIASGIEQIPYALGFEDLGPLYVRYYNNVCIHFDSIKAIKHRLEQKLLDIDDRFWPVFTTRLNQVYADFDRETDKVRCILEGDNLRIDNLIEIFESWWKVHNDFFATTYLIQSMGDDIIWPKINETLGQVGLDDAHVLEYSKILSSPIRDDEIITSMKFASETFKLLKESGNSINNLIWSELDETIVLDKINDVNEGQNWLKKLAYHCEQWGWIRERDPYFDPILNEIGMIMFIRKYAPKDEVRVEILKNLELFAEVKEQLWKRINPIERQQLSSYIEIGRFLHRERDNHHYKWIKNTSAVREIILSFGNELQKLGFIQNVKDVFFLTIPEILTMLRDHSAFTVNQTREKIELRITHFAKETRITPHRSIDISQAPTHFDDIF